MAGREGRRRCWHLIDCASAALENNKKKMFQEKNKENVTQNQMDRGEGKEEEGVAGGGERGERNGNCGNAARND